MAKALDVIGQRWALLIVRELLFRGPCRYTDLRAGLPGLATNLLADRLRELEEVGVVRREAAPPPVATTLFHLTDRGAHLRPVIDELVRWGAPLMSQPDRQDAFRGHWLIPPVELFLRDAAPDQPPVVLEIRADDPPVLIETVDGAVRGRVGTANHPTATLSGPPDVIIGLLFGDLTLARARARGLRYAGPPAALRRLQHEPMRTTTT
jgi:DNA-binding HxlR family transcriptional regulator